MEALTKEYDRLLRSQDFNPAELDYTLMDRHRELLTQLARVSNCGITVFDMHRRGHTFASYNFANLFGYDMARIEEKDVEYFDSLVHPDDMPMVMRNGIAALRHFMQEENRHKLGHGKLISEYRIRGQEGYIRVIEQFQVLEFDAKGNIWLSLCVMDISPDQGPFKGVQSKLVDCHSGEVIPLEKLDREFPDPQAPTLSEREKGVLRLVRDGYLSKEISERLTISVHTVNTHRQRILEKLNVDNSMEAVGYASRYGLI